MVALKDSDNIARLEALRPKWERLRDAKIRASADVAHRSDEVRRKKELAVEAAGTEDESEIRKIIIGRYERNTVAVDAFEAAVNAAEAAMDEAEAGRGEG